MVALTALSKNRILLRIRVLDGFSDLLKIWGIFVNFIRDESSGGDRT